MATTPFVHVLPPTESERTAIELRSRDRLARLQDVTAALSAAATLEEVAEVATTLGSRAVEAPAAALWMRAPSGGMWLASISGESCGALAPTWEERRAFESGLTAWLEGTEGQAQAIVPLEAHRRVLGVLAFRFEHTHVFGEDERAFIETVAVQCGQALDRARLLAEAHDRERALGELAERLAREKQAAERSQARFARMFEANLIGAITWEVGGAVVAANDAFLRAVDYTREDLERGVIDWRALTPEEFRSADAANVDTLLEHGVHAPYEKEYFRKDGTRVPVLISSAFFPDSKHEGVAFVVDLTQVKAAEAELKRLYDAERNAREQSMAAMRIRDEFLATVSHELRTPLNAILGWIQLLRTGTLPVERREHALSVIDRNARVQEQLIADLLDVSRVITGRLRLNVVRVRLEEVVDMAVEVVRPSASDKHITLHVDLDHQAPAVLGDPDRLQQVIWNLLTNAVRFTPDGGRIEVRVATELPNVIVSVTDTGKGMAPDFIEYAFQPFRQADASFSRRQKGLGLGLAITRSLVEMHAGTVEARSEGEGRGSTFMVRMPVATLRPEATPRVPAFSVATPRPMRSPMATLSELTVLVVEDEPDSRELMVSLLEQHGAKVLAAASAGEALEKLTLATPDVILSDIGLPGEDGLSLIRKVRMMPVGAHLPAVALTAFVSSADRQRALEAGFDAHVAKPIEPDALLCVMVDLVAKRSSKLLAR